MNIRIKARCSACGKVKASEELYEITLNQRPSESLDVDILCLSCYGESDDE